MMGIAVALGVFSTGMEVNRLPGSRETLVHILLGKDRGNPAANADDVEAAHCFLLS